MKPFGIISLFLFAAVLCISAVAGGYVPPVHFMIDDNGQQSPIFDVDPLLVHRVRRSPQFGSTSSSSSSTVTSSGSRNNNNGGGGLDARSGDGADTKVTGHTQTTTTNNGKFTHTSSRLGEDGKVHFNMQSGKF